MCLIKYEEFAYEKIINTKHMPETGKNQC